MKRIVGVVLLLSLVCSVSGVKAAEKATEGGPDSAAFKDPYNGGDPLPDGGGEPGKAYVALINAIYDKDYAQICELNDVEKDECSKSKDGIDFLIGLLSNPKSHKVAGGFVKGDSATLTVVYTWANKSVSSAMVTMERKHGKWIFAGLSAHAEQTIEAHASATATFGSGAGAADSPFGPINMAANRRQYTGDKCPIDIVYTATINFKLPLPKDFMFTYHWERSDGAKGQEQVVTPTGKERAMSVKETWKIGSSGQQYDASMKLFIDMGNTHIIKESPAVRVICK